MGGVGADKKKSSMKCRKGFLGKILCKSPHILREKKSKVTIFRQGVPEGRQKKAKYSSQIWLLPLVDDC